MTDTYSDLLIRARLRLQSAEIPDSERELLQDLCNIIQQQAAELDALKRISRNLTSSLALTVVLDAVVAEAMGLVKGARDVHIFLHQDGLLRFGAALDSNGQHNLMYAAPRHNGLTYSVANSGQMMVVEDMSQHALFNTVPRDWAGSIIGIPLKMGDRVVGVMNLARMNVGKFTDAELRLLRLLADQAAIAISNAGLHEAVSKQAYTDILTSLPNRRALDERMDEEVRRAGRFGHSFGVVMMDLDGFKAINDTYGHSVGDDVLHKTFSLLAQNLRTTDFLARYGGDELTLIMPESNLEGAQIVADKLQQQLNALTVTMPDGTVRHFAVSGGIAIFPMHARNAPDLLRAADEALYRAKKHARGTFVPARGFTGELKMPRPTAPKS